MNKLVAIMAALVMACGSTKTATPPVAKTPVSQEDPQVVDQNPDVDEQYTMVAYKGKTWSVQLPSSDQLPDVQQTDHSVDIKGKDGVFQFLVEDRTEDTEALAQGMMAVLLMQKGWQPTQIADGKVGEFAAKEVLYQGKTGVLVALIVGTGTHCFVLVYGGKISKSRAEMFKASVASLTLTDKPVVAPKPAKK